MSPKNKRSKKPDTPLGKVPPIRELCEKLGFQHASLKDIRSFEDTTRAWRKSYRTRNGNPGSDLLSWNESSVQLDLQAMAEGFIKDNGNAERFWSSTRSWNHDSDIQYPEDLARIVELLKQLFWKQNRYAANNNVYSHKPGSSRDTSHEKHEEVFLYSPIEDRDEFISISDRMQSSVDLSHHASNRAASGAATSKLNPLEETSKRNKDSHVVLEVTKEKDVYEVSDDDDDTENPILKLPITLPIQPSKTLKSKRTLETEKVETRKKVRTNSGDSPRRTYRKRIPPHRPGIVPFVSEDFFDEMMNTPPISEPQTEPDIDIATNFSEIDRETTQASSTLAQPTTSFSAPITSMIPSHEPSELVLSQSKTRPSFNSELEQSQVGAGQAAQYLKTPSSEKDPVDDESYGFPKSDIQFLRSHMTMEEASNADNISSHRVPLSANISVEPTRTLVDPKGETPKPRLEAISQQILPLSKGFQKEGSSTSTASSKPRTKLQVHLWIITREPRYTEERWPDGKFSGAQLSDFLEGVSKVTQRTRIEKLKLTLQTSTSDTKFTVRKDDEYEWTYAKKIFGEKLKDAAREVKSKNLSEEVVFKILIEPFYEEVSGVAENIDGEESEVEF